MATILQKGCPYYNGTAVYINTFIWIISFLEMLQINTTL